MTKLASEGFFTFRAQDDKMVEILEEKSDVAVGFASPWQLGKLRQSSDAIGLDSTHGVVRFKNKKDEGKFRAAVDKVRKARAEAGLPDRGE